MAFSAKEENVQTNVAGNAVAACSSRQNGETRPPAAIAPVWREFAAKTVPRCDEIATGCDRDPRAMYWRQMRNGMWIRAVLIAATFGYEHTVMDCGY